MKSGSTSFRARGALFHAEGPWIKGLSDPATSTFYTQDSNPSKNPTFRNPDDVYKVI